MKWQFGIQKTNNKLTLLMALGLSLLVAGPVTASDYPSKTIECLIPWNPGGGTDTTIRLVNSVMDNYLSQRIILINRPGGHGTIAMTELINAAPDGYKICVTASGPTTSLPHKEKVPYTRDDYIPIVMLTNVPNLLVANPDSPHKSFEDVLKASKKNPGSVKIAISGVGAVSSHLPLIRLEKMTGAKFTTVPYKGGGGAATQVVGGHVPVGSVDLMAAGNHIRGGRLKPLAIFAEKRSDILPDTPTLKELGYDITGSFFNIIIVPKGTPQDVIDTLHTAFKKALADEAVLSKAKKIGLQIEYKGPAGCRQRIDNDYEMIGELYKELGLAK